MVDFGLAFQHIQNFFFFNYSSSRMRSTFQLSGSGGLVLDDRPEIVAQAIILFLQGRGFG